MGLADREQRKTEGSRSLHLADPHFGGERKVREGNPARARANEKEHSAALVQVARTQADFRRQGNQENSRTLLRRSTKQN